MSVTVILIGLLLIGLIKNQPQLFSFDKTLTQPLRGLLSLLIVSHHLGQNTAIPYLSSFCQCIGYQIVAVFFFMSGYGLCVSYSKKGSSYLDKFLTHRLGKLLPSFMILTVGTVLAFHFLSRYSIRMQLHDFITVGGTSLPFSWFIYTIIYSYFSFYFCAKIGKSLKRTGLLFLISSFLYVMVLSCATDFGKYWWMTILSINVGYGVALYEPVIEKTFMRNKYLAYPLLIIVLFITFYASHNIPFKSDALTMTWILIQAFAVYIIIRTLGMVSWKVLVFIGTISLELYLIHGLPILVFKKIGLQEPVLWIFTFITAIIGAYLLKRVIGNSNLKFKGINLIRRF